MKKLVLLLILTLTAAVSQAGTKEQPMPGIGWPYKSFANYYRMSGASTQKGLIQWLLKNYLMDCRFDNGVCQWAYFEIQRGSSFSPEQVRNILVNMSGENSANWNYLRLENGSTVFSTKDGVFAASVDTGSTGLMIGYFAYIQNVNVDGTSSLGN
jgi:hypothetical protein